MANQFASTNALNGALAILKNWYAGPIVSQFNDEIPFYREVEKGKEKYNGLQVIRPVKVRRNPGIGATSDGGNLPAIGQQTTQQAQIAAKFNYLRFGITGPMIKASQGDKGAFVSAMEFEMSEGLTDLKQDVNRQLMWNGDGTLGIVAANVVASNTVTVSGRTSGENGNKYLDVGIVIDIIDGTTSALKASGLSITSISGTATATIVLSGAVTCSTSDKVIRTGTSGNEVSGIQYTLDGGTTTIYNINRSTYPVYQGNVLSNSSNSLSLNFMKQGWNQGKQRGGAKYDFISCDFDSERFYEKLLIADKRYMGKVKGDGTFSEKDENYLEYGGIPIVPDKDMPDPFFYFLDTKQWKKYVLAELEWADETGTYLIAQTSADAFEARLRLFFNLFCEKPSAQVLLGTYISP
jgi:hypothetical protein